MTKPALTPLPRLIQLYRETYSLTERGESSRAFSTICTVLGLEIDPVSHRAFDLLLGKLCEVKRFEGNPHLADHRKGTTGQHTLMVMPLIAAVGTLALGRNGAAGRFNSRAWAKGADAVQDMVHDMCIQVLMHDLGEEICELSSLSQRRKAGKLAEQPKLERRIAEFAMRLAYYAVLSSPDEGRQKKLFNREIDAIRARVDPAKEYAEEVVGQTIGRQIEASIGAVSVRLHLDMLPRAVVPHLRNYMAAYDEPEGFSHFAYFNGGVVKHCQNMQTVLHMAEHLNRDGAVPYHLANSSEARAALWYADRGLGKLHQAANPANPLQQAIVKASAEMAYAINLAILDAPIPCMIDRAARLKTTLEDSASAEDRLRAESQPQEEAARRGEIRASIRRHMAGSTGLTDFSTPELSAGQLQVAYAAAYELAREGGYAPPATSLADCRELPEALAQRMLARQHQPVEVPQMIEAFTGGAVSTGSWLRPQQALRAS